MALSSDEQELFDFAMEAMPSWYRDIARDREVDNAYAVMFQDVRDKVTNWLVTNTIISTADGVSTATGEADWIGQHARDRGTWRQTGESDATLVARLKNTPDAVTIESLLSATAAILLADGISAEPALVDLRAERGFVGSIQSQNGTGASIEATGSTPGFRFKPHVTPPWARNLNMLQTRPRDKSASKLAIISGAFTVNLGDFDILDLDGDDVLFSNGTGVTQSGTAIKWAVDPVGADGQYLNRHASTAARADSFMSRGYRAAFTRAAFIIILPYGATAAAEASVSAMLDEKKGAGIVAYVERRLNP